MGTVSSINPSNGSSASARLCRSTPSLERNKWWCNKRACKSNKCGNMQNWLNLREICRICAKFARNLRKFAKLFLQTLRKFARNLRPRLLRYRLFLSECTRFHQGEVLRPMSCVAGTPAGSCTTSGCVGGLIWTLDAERCSSCACTKDQARI